MAMVKAGVDDQRVGHAVPLELVFTGNTAWQYLLTSQMRGMKLLGCTEKLLHEAA